MKRIYLISAALILLMTITAGFYLNKYRGLNNNDAAISQANPADDGDLAISENYSQNNPITSDTSPAITGDNTISNNTAFEPVAGDSYHRRGSHSRHSRNSRSIINKYAAPVEESPVAVNVSSNEIGIETPKDYFAHTPPPIVNRPASRMQNQNNKEKSRLSHNIDLGLEIGYNQSSLANNHTSNIPIGNVNVGLLVNFGLGDHFAIQPGIRYISMGNRLQNEMDVDNKEKLTLHYMQLPVNLIWKFGKPGNTRFMVGAGPYAAYLAGAKDNFQASGAGPGSDVIQTETPQYSVNNVNKFDWGFGGFIGCQSPDGIFAKAGGELGMMNTMQNTDGNSNRNYNFGVTIGYLFGGK